MPNWKKISGVSRVSIYRSGPFGFIHTTRLPISWDMWVKWIAPFCAVQTIIINSVTMWEEVAWNNFMKNNSWATGALSIGSKTIKTGSWVIMQTANSTLQL